MASIGAKELKRFNLNRKIGGEPKDIEKRGGAYIKW